jgi:hypothetical protein
MDNIAADRVALQGVDKHSHDWLAGQRQFNDFGAACAAVCFQKGSQWQLYRKWADALAIHGCWQNAFAAQGFDLFAKNFAVL